LELLDFNAARSGEFHKGLLLCTYYSLFAK
jgi:hypothetical protein